ncbi:hypothetical protein [Mycobacterium sp. shizuoka-1]|uniref:hypothetical protein n=1 Tax=Mycobacterium sp. shizuoka-1 TaxID=2039281 RepID=UPI000C05D9CF|nr:hypothetical protein [Mycobacterium sp. shizuoka-1]GAY19015.1 hypothetical protein MSZK_57410 [Mycobacterium sp. shizuoka-1]
MNSDQLSSLEAVEDWINSHPTKGEGMTRPYSRKWENGGCRPTHSLRHWRTDPVKTLASGLVSLGYSVVGVDNGVLVDVDGLPVRVSGNRSVRGEGPPQEYVLQVDGRPVEFVGDAPEVVVELVRDLPSRPSPPAEVDFIQIGFPGHGQDEVTYVGSWQWDIHGEARGSEFVDRAAAATLAAIEAAGRD